MERGDEEATAPAEFVDPSLLESLPSRYQEGVQQAVMLLRFFENKEGMNYAPVFTPLLGSIDEAARGLITRTLLGSLPPTVPDQKAWFVPYLGDVDRRTHNHYKGMAQNLKRTLVFKNGISPLGLLRSCLDYALNDKTDLGGVFEAVTARFQVKGSRDLLARVEAVNDFRNTFVAHHERDLTDKQLAEASLKEWVECLAKIRSFG